MAQQPSSNPAPRLVESDADDKKREYTKLLVPLGIVVVIGALVAVSSARWDQWQAAAAVQSTDNAYVRAEISRLSARVAGNVSRVAFDDFGAVKKGQLLVEIDPGDYRAKQLQARASLDFANAQLTNLANQEALQAAAVAQAQAQKRVADESALLANQERDRQASLFSSGSGTAQKNDQAQTDARSKAASAQAADAAVKSATAQLAVTSGQEAQLKANVDAAKATLASADLAVGYTQITAPFDGVVSERQVHVGDYVNVGSNAVTLVPLPHVYLIANFKETQLSRMVPGQKATISVDALPGRSFSGTVSRLSPGAGSQFALLPADNATGNFTKVVQRIPVRIDFVEGADLETLRPGMSAVVSVDVSGD